MMIIITVITVITIIIIFVNVNQSSKLKINKNNDLRVTPKGVFVPPTRKEIMECSECAICLELNNTSSIKPYSNGFIPFIL